MVHPPCLEANTSRKDPGTLTWGFRFLKVAWKMSDLRKDPTRGHWVLVRAAGNAAPASGDCPFCPGSESRTPPEIVAFRNEDSAPDGPGWSVRVVPELDP